MAALPKTQERIQKVRELINGGMGVSAACKEARLASSQWYAAQGKTARSMKLKRKYNKAPKYVDLTPAQTASVAIILCAHDQIKTILAGLK